MAMQADGLLSPQGSLFHRNIRHHSTPLIANGANSSTNRSTNSNKKRGNKRKLVDSVEVIDLTPNKPRLPSNDSDVEIIEPEPPTIIDLEADDPNNCNALTVVNATAEIAIASTSDVSPENENEIENVSSSSTLNVIVDSSGSTELVDTSIEARNAIEIDQSNTVQVPLYVKDASGGSSIKPPLNDIVSDESFCFDSPFATPISSFELSQNKTLTNNVDDSVVFVSETIQTPKRVPALSRADEFIPIGNGGRFGNRSQLKKGRSPKGKGQKRKSPRKTTQSSNLMQIAPTPKPTSPVTRPVSGIKRMVLIDGNNVAYSHSRNKEFSVEGIDICLKYFTEKGYDCKAICPQMRLKKTKSSNQDLLAKLESEGKVVFSPCKNLPNGKKVTSYDDRFILDFAADYDAAVISNDNYRDLSKESEKYRDIISTRVIGFTFLNDIIRFPQDPYGKFGPSLDDILNGKRETI